MSPDLKRCGWILAVVNCGPLGVLAGALAMQDPGTSGALMGIAAACVAMGVSILSLYKLLSSD